MQLKPPLFIVVLLLHIFVHCFIEQVRADLIHVSSSQLQHASLQWDCRSDLEVQIHVFTVWHMDSFPVVFTGARFLWPPLGSNPAFVRFGDGIAEFDPIFVVKSLDSASKTVLAETFISHTYAAALSVSQQPWIVEAGVCCVWDASGPTSSNGVVIRALVVAKASLASPFLWLPPINFLRKGSLPGQRGYVKYYTRLLKPAVISVSDPAGMASAGFIESSFNRHPVPDGVSLAVGSNSVVFQFDAASQKYLALASFACTSLVLSASARIDLLSLSISSQVVSTVCEGVNPIFAATSTSDVSYEAIAVPSAASLLLFTTSPALSNLQFFVLSQPQSLLLLPGPVQVGDACRSVSVTAIATTAFIACLRITVKWTPAIEDVGESALSILTYSTDTSTGNVVVGDVASVALFVAPPVTPSITFDESSTLTIPVRLNELIAIDLRSSSDELISPTKPLPTNAALVSNQGSLFIFLFRPLPFQGSDFETFCFQQSHSNLTVTSCLNVRVYSCGFESRSHTPFQVNVLPCIWRTAEADPQPFGCTPVYTPIILLSFTFIQFDAHSSLFNAERRDAAKFGCDLWRQLAAFGVGESHPAQTIRHSSVPDRRSNRHKISCRPQL